MSPFLTQPCAVVPWANNALGIGIRQPSRIPTGSALAVESVGFLSQAAFADAYQTLVPKQNRAFRVACCSGANVEDAFGRVCDL
jgi:hypothetical protein